MPINFTALQSRLRRLFVTASNEASNKNLEAVTKLEAILYAPGGRIQREDLLALVRTYPDPSAAMARYIIDRADSKDNGEIQRAVLIGGLFAEAFEDDTVIEYVSLRLKEKQITGFRTWGIEPSTQPAATLGIEPSAEPAATLGLVILEVQRAQVLRGDIDSFLETFGNFEGLQKYRGRCILSFAYDTDLREVHEIPECRAYVAKIHSAMPYFPYVLNGHPEMAALFTYLACLVPSDTLVPPNYIEIAHPAVIEVIDQIFYAVVRTAQRLGEDPAQLVSDLFKVFPADFTDLLVRVANDLQTNDHP